MKSPCITTTNQYGNNRTLYFPSIPSLELNTRPNLSKTLKELDLEDGQKIFIADSTSPNTMTFELILI